MDRVNKATDDLVRTILDSEIYLNYQEQKKKVNQDPDMKKRIDDFREKNYTLQNSVEAEKMFDQVDWFEKEYEEFREIPLVNDFLSAELDLCRMLQEINIKITDAVDL